MCEKLGRTCLCRLMRFIEQSKASLGELTELDLSFNSLEVLPAGVFQCLPKLQRLVLRDNKIKVLPKEVAHAKELRTIDLSGNLINQLPVQELLSLPKLSKVFLFGNSVLSKEFFKSCQDAHSMEMKALRRVFVFEDRRLEKTC